MRLLRPPPASLLLAASRGPNRDSRIIGYEAAAWLYGFDGYPSLKPAFIVPHGTWRRGPFDHQRRRIDAIEIVELEGLVITSVRQTLADLCGVDDAHADLDRVERAVESALRMELVSEPELRDYAWLFVYWRHGTPGLLKVLDRRPIGAPPTGSDLETLYLQCVRGHVPDPTRQMPVLTPDGRPIGRADFGWWPTKFVVETDGVEHHKTPEQVLYDTTRQNALIGAGYDLRRFTYRHIMRVPAYVIRETRLGLTRAGLDLSKIQKRVG